MTSGRCRDKGAPARENILVLLKKARGDEEIPANVAAIILAEPLAHLSHLAIRARQEGVILAHLDDQAAYTGLQQENGKRVHLWATPDRVLLTEEPFL